VCPSAGAAAERAARESLRAQVAKLERELSGIVAGCFPHVSSAPVLDPARPPGWAGPHLLSLAELERLRDRLVVRVRGAQRQAVRQAELVRRSRDLLERMKEEPGRYKFVRLPVTALGERGCGVWEVRPRLGLIGMLAGWWELKLSSGCPLPEAARPARAAPHLLSAIGACSWQAEASVWRWRSVNDPRVLVSGMCRWTSSLWQRVAPHLRWLISRSATVMLCASQGHSRITSAASSSPVAILRLSSARASRTLLARSRARMY
jgi:hypothetical protein